MNLRFAFDYIKSHLWKLNLFYIGVDDEDTIRNQRRSTRFYLLFLFISISILIMYYSIIFYTVQIVVQSPTLEQYSNLIKDYSLKCPCSNLAIKYDKFVQLEPSYHELCQSDFVSDEWLQNLYTHYQTASISVQTDFRRTALYQFQTIRSLCQLAKNTINDDLESFKSIEFSQSQVITREIFNTEINSFIRNFLNTLPKTFMRALHFIQDTTAQSLFMTGALLTNVRPVMQYRLTFDQGILPFPGINYTFLDGSSCVCSASTATNCMGPALFENNTVPGFLTGCYMLSALLNSTLEAFYNQTFVDILSTNSSTRFHKLNSSNSSSTIETLLNQMTVNFWSNITSFEQYFYNCAPSLCQYTTNQRYSFWTVVILLIGLIGGLSTAFKFIIPILVIDVYPIIKKFICQRKTQMTTSETTNSKPRKYFFQNIKNTLINLNLFKSIPPSEDTLILRQQRYQTRIYLIFLLISSLICICFLSIQLRTVNVTIESPSLTKTIYLYDKYPLTLNCPCSQTAIKYNEFISNIEVNYHEICLSEFVTSHWINVQYIRNPVREFFVNDIRYLSKMHFQLLSTLCRVANQTINENLDAFYETKLITQRLLSRSFFESQTNLMIDEFKRSTPESYQRTLQLIQANAEINQFVTPLNSNFENPTYINGYLYYTLIPYSYKNRYHVVYLNGTDNSYVLLHDDHNCISLSTSECLFQAMIGRQAGFVFIPGIFQTSFPLQSVLRSTFECFYSVSCLSKILRLIDPVLSPTNFSILQLALQPLNDSNHQYDSIETLANQLFIQSWNNQSSYQSYFEQCHPLTCQYSYETRFNIVYIITTLIGLLGGLSIALRLITPIVFKIGSRIWNKVISQQDNQELNSTRTSKTMNYLK